MACSCRPLELPNELRWQLKATKKLGANVCKAPTVAIGRSGLELAGQTGTARRNIYKLIYKLYLHVYIYRYDCLDVCLCAFKFFFT